MRQRAGMVLQLLAPDRWAGRNIGRGVEDDKTGPGVAEIGVDNDKVLRAHGRSRARHAVGQQHEGIGGTECGAEDADRTVIVSGQRLGKWRPGVADARGLSPQCRLHVSLDAINMDVELVLAAPVGGIDRTRLIAVRGKGWPAARSVKPRSRQAAAK